MTFASALATHNIPQRLSCKHKSRRLWFWYLLTANWQLAHCNRTLQEQGGAENSAAVRSVPTDIKLTVAKKSH